MTASPFGYLIPLALGSDDNDISPLPDATTLLSLPDSFGRAELLEPYAKKKCSKCQHIKKEREGQKGKHSGGIIELCQTCQSIHSLAKFIPRKDFLSFAYHRGSKEKQSLVLAMPTRNSEKLVRVASASLGCNNDMVGEQKTEDGIPVNDGDIVSICWYQASDCKTSSKALKPLIRFRVHKFSERETTKSILTEYDDVVQKNIEHASTGDGDVKANSGFGKEKITLYENVTGKDERGLVLSVNGSQESSEEEVDESAPLSLPSKFLASSSKSFSFDSQLQSASPSKVILHAAADGYSSSQKRKLALQEEDATTSSFTTTKTPKKSNVNVHHDGNDRAGNTDTIPLSSLSYNQLLQLRDQSSASSLRHNVLSLSLALTSNASAYDSKFLKEIQDSSRKQAGKEESNDSTSKTSLGSEANTSHWMPRLLHGTQITLNNKSRDEK